MPQNQNQLGRAGVFNQNVSQQQSLYLQQQQQQQNLQLQQQQNLHLQQQQNIRLQQQQLLLQSQLQSGMGGVTADQRSYNMQQNLGIVAGYSAQPQQAQGSYGVNPYANPNSVSFYQQEHLKMNQIIQQQQQQVFTLQWQTQGQTQPTQFPSDLKNDGNRSLLGNTNFSGNNATNSSSISDFNFSRDTGIGPPAPPPPVPQEHTLQQNPPPPPASDRPPTSNNLFQPQPDTAETGKILSTNLPGLLDIISGSGSAKKGKDKESAVIPGLGDLDVLDSSPKLSSEETLKPVRPVEQDQNSGNSNKDIKSNVSDLKPSSRNSNRDIQSNLSNLKSSSSTVSEPSVTSAHKTEDQSVSKSSSEVKPSRGSVVSDAGSNVSSSAASGIDFLFSTDGSPGGATSSNYNKSTLKAFDKKFREWEKQFEDWKKANAGHPDRVAYGKYMGQWEAWREQLVQQRRFIIDNITKERLATIDVNIEKEKALNETDNSNFTVGSRTG